MKRPAFQFYPADWRKDAALQTCSMAAQGLWMNILCVMHECEPYGHLAVNGNAMQGVQIARLFGMAPKECERLIAELESTGVASRSDQGFLFSRRMVRDESLRTVRAQAGRLGGNPDLVGKKVNQKDNQTPNQSEKQKPTPSSSSSSTNQKPMAAAFAAPEWIPPDCWRAWLEIRERKKARNTPFALGLAVQKLADLRGKGYPPDEVLNASILGGWSDLYEPKNRSSVNGVPVWERP